MVGETLGQELFRAKSGQAQEQEFQSWYQDRASKLGLNPNPDDPQHFYDYRAAHRAGAEPDETGHWPSQFKQEGHPRMVVNGVNTKTGQTLGQQLFAERRSTISPEQRQDILSRTASKDEIDLQRHLAESDEYARQSRAIPALEDLKRPLKGAVSGVGMALGGLAEGPAAFGHAAAQAFGGRGEKLDVNAPFERLASRIAPPAETTFEQVLEGVGQTLPTMALAPVSLPAAAGAGALQHAYGAYQNTLAATGKEDEARRALVLNLPVGLLDVALPGLSRLPGASRVLSKLVPVLGKIEARTGGAISRAVLGGITEGTTESAQRVMENAIANYATSEERDLFEGAFEEGEAGGYVGAILNLLFGRRGGLRGSQADRAPGLVDEGGPERTSPPDLEASLERSRQLMALKEGGPPGVPVQEGQAPPGTSPAPVRPEQHIMAPEEVATPQPQTSPALGTPEEDLIARSRALDEKIAEATRNFGRGPVELASKDEVQEAELDLQEAMPSIREFAESEEAAKERVKALQAQADLHLEEQLGRFEAASKGSGPNLEQAPAQGREVEQAPIEALPPKRSEVEAMMAFPPPLLSKKAKAEPVPEEITQGFDIPDETLFRKAQRKAQDALGRLSVVQEAVKEQGGDIPESADVKTKTELFPGKVEEGQRRGTEYVKAITETAGRGNKKIGDLDEFVEARAAEQRNKVIQQRRVEEATGARKKRLEERRAFLEKHLEKSRQGALKQLDREVLRVEQVTEQKIKLAKNRIENGKGTPEKKANKLIQREAELRDMADTQIDKIFERMEERFLSREMADQAALEARKAKIQKKESEVAAEWTAGSGMTDEQAQEILAKYADDPQMQRIGELVDKLRKETRQIAVEGELISQETSDAWEKIFGLHHVPLKTNVEGMREGSGSGFSVARGPFSKRAKGRRTRADSPLTFAVLQYQQAILQAEQNKVGLSVLDFVTRNPDDSQWRVYEPGKRPKDLPPLSPDRTFTVKVKGEPKIIEFSDPLLAKGLLNLGRSRGGQLGRLFMNAARIYSRLNTSYDPDFILPNLARDVVTAGMNMSVEQGTAFGLRITKPKNLYKSFRAIYRVMSDPKKSGEYEDYFKEMRRAGGKVGWFHQKSFQQVFDEIESDLKALGEEGSAMRLYRAGRKTLDAIDTLNSGLENAVRLSIYIEARKAGFSVEQAAKLSRGATVDFNKHGEWGPAINAAYLFANANIQSTARGATTFVKNPKRAAALSGSMAALGATIATLGLAMGGEDEDGIPFWDKLSESDKQRNIIFLIPGWMDESGKPRVVKIPLSYFWAHFYNMGRVATESALGSKKKSQAMQDLVKSAVTNFAPIGGEADLLQTVMPTLGDPVAQIYSNKTWDNRPIYPPDAFDNYKKPDSQRFYSSVKPLSKKLAQALNEITGGDEYHEGMIDWSPESIDHMIDFAGGGAGRTLRRSINAANKALKGEVPKLHEVPIIRRFVGDGNYQAYDRERYHEHLNEMAILEDRVRKATKSGSIGKIDTPEARQIINENRAAWRIRDEWSKKTGGKPSLEEQLNALKDAKDEKAEAQFYLDFNKKWREATGRNP